MSIPWAPIPYCPHLEVLTNTSGYFMFPNPGAQDGRGLSTSARNPLHTQPGMAQSGAEHWLLNGRAQAEAFLAEGGVLPSLGAVWPRLRKPGRPCAACLPQREGTEESPQPDAITPQVVACQPGPPRTPPQFLHIGADRAARGALPSLRMALIVPGALRHRAAGPWLPMGMHLREQWLADG